MKKFLSILKATWILSALPVAFYSCSTDSDPDENQQEEAENGIIIKMENDGEEVDLPEGTGLGLFFLGADSSVTPYAMTVGEESESPMPDLNDMVSACAYSPYSSNLFNVDNYQEAQRFTVAVDQSNEDGYDNSNLMIAPLTQIANGGVSLKMQRMMAKVTVHVTDVTGNYDLNELDLTMRDRYTSVMADIQTATVTPLTDDINDIVPYKTTSNAYRVSASVILPPGNVGKGTEIVYMEINGDEFAYNMEADEEWISGKEYVYSLRLTSEGIVPYKSEVIDWTEGDNDLTGDVEMKVPYTIGDYITADGGFLKVNELTNGNKDDVVALVFSTDVSENDAQAGYNAYAVSVQPHANVGWIMDAVVDVSRTGFMDALGDLDGREHTEYILASSQYEGLADKTKCVFSYVNDLSKIDSESVSKWFVPSFGQMIQILNNLGDAGITDNTSIDESNPGSVALYSSENLDVINKVNSYGEALGKSLFANNGVYITTTESGSQFWNVNILNDHFEFGRSAYKTGNNRNVLVCIAVSLPEI